ATILIWDVAALTARPAPAPPLTPARAEMLWQALAEPDPAKADPAMRELAARPADAVAVLKSRLGPVPPPDAARLQELLADLNAGKFATREKAKRDLEALEERALPALRKALKGTLPLEARRRLEALAARLEEGPCPPETLRGLRAVEVLEQHAT